MIVAGIDIGSVATKAALLDAGRVVGRGMCLTAADPRKAAETALEAALAEAGLPRAKIGRTMATGYGRRAVKIADDAVTEITAAARGAHGAFGQDVGLIIDLGGQDTKTIALDAEGRVRDFLMNDKCAAGTGKFLEAMAHVLGLSIEELAEIAAAGADSPAVLSSTCTVFAESEVISLVHRGVPVGQIAAGLHAAIAGRIAAMAEQVGRSEDAVFIGGGARNGAMRIALENALGAAIRVPDYPQFTVAAGAALIAAAC